MDKYPMTAEERQEAFPIHIDLGRKSEDLGTTPVSPKKGNKKLYYPTVYIDGIKDLDKLPKKGCMLVDFRRTRLSIEETGDGDSNAGVTLEIRAFCLPENSVDGEYGESLGDAMERFMKEPSDKERDDDEEEED